MEKKQERAAWSVFYRLQHEANEKHLYSINRGADLLRKHCYDCGIHLSLRECKVELLHSGVVLNLRLGPYRRYIPFYDLHKTFERIQVEKKQ